MAIMAAGRPDTAFQATDLNRRHREVLAAARETGGAVIRDKDGLTLLLEPAAHAAHREHLLTWLLSAVRISRTLQRPLAERSAWDFGDFGWIADLDADDQESFLEGFLSLLLKNVDADYSSEVDEYLADWRATAQAWADPELRMQLRADLNRPLLHVEL